MVLRRSVCCDSVARATPRSLLSLRTVAPRGWCAQLRTRALRYATAALVATVAVLGATFALAFARRVAWMWTRIARNTAASMPATAPSRSWPQPLSQLPSTILSSSAASSSSAAAAAASLACAHHPLYCRVERVLGWRRLHDDAPQFDDVHRGVDAGGNGGIHGTDHGAYQRAKLLRAMQHAYFDTLLMPEPTRRHELARSTPAAPHSSSSSPSTLRFSVRTTRVCAVHGRASDWCNEDARVPAASDATLDDGWRRNVQRYRFETHESTPIEESGSRTAIVLVDLWDTHWCKTAAARATAMMPKLNRALAAARARGVLIVHAPTDVVRDMDVRVETHRHDVGGEHVDDEIAAVRAMRHRVRALVSAHETASAAAGAGAAVEDSVAQSRRAERLRASTEAAPYDRNMTRPLPRASGCMCSHREAQRCPLHYGWSSMNPALAIDAVRDVLVADDTDELLSVLRARGIRTVIYAGVHLNMCVSAQKRVSMVKLARAMESAPAVAAGRTPTSTAAASRAGANRTASAVATLPDELRIVFARDMVDALTTNMPARRGHRAGPNRTPERGTARAIDFVQMHGFGSVSLRDMFSLRDECEADRGNGRDSRCDSGSSGGSCLRIAPWGTLVRPHVFDHGDSVHVSVERDANGGAVLNGDGDEEEGGAERREPERGGKEEGGERDGDGEKSKTKSVEEEESQQRTICAQEREARGDKHIGDVSTDHSRLRYSGGIDIDGDNKRRRQSRDDQADGAGVGGASPHGVVRVDAMRPVTRRARRQRHSAAFTKVSRSGMYAFDEHARAGVDAAYRDGPTRALATSVFLEMPPPPPPPDTESAPAAPAYPVQLRDLVAASVRDGTLRAIPLFAGAECGVAMNDTTRTPDHDDGGGGGGRRTNDGTATARVCLRPNCAYRLADASARSAPAHGGGSVLRARVRHATDVMQRTRRGRSHAGLCSATAFVTLDADDGGGGGANGGTGGAVARVCARTPVLYPFDARAWPWRIALPDGGRAPIALTLIALSASPRDEIGADRVRVCIE